MIDLYSIVEAASFLLDKGELILHRSMRVHDKFKAYKIFSYDIYYVSGKEKKILSSFSKTKNVLADDLDIEWQTMDKLYLREFIKWITETDFKKLTDNGI